MNMNVEQMNFDYFADDTKMKFSHQDYFYQGYSPKTKETDSDMDLEYLNTGYQMESPSYSQSKKPEASSSLNHSKDSLKFARRIAKSFLQFAKQDTDVVLRAFLDCGAKILASQVSILGVEIIDESKLMNESLQIIDDVWNYFSKNLSCSYNKKISKVTKDIWDIVFTEEGFWKAVKEVGTKFQLKDHFSGCGEVEAEIIRNYYKKVLFLVNRALILVHLHLKKSGKDNFYENIPKFENYIVLGMVPALFDCYNHKRGVFVDECCKACKVCQSKLADKSTVRKIKTAWEYAIAFEQHFRSNNNFQSFQDPLNPLNILQFLTVLDETVAQLM